MRNAQRGLSLWALIGISFILIIVALLGMKLVPPLLQYQSVRSAIYSISTEGLTSPGEIRGAFQKFSAIDDIDVVQPADLDITRDGSRTVISAQWRTEVPLFLNSGIYINFSVSSSTQN